ncbi:hypothetical protein niasHT_027908 [Heterodera trifolii]|uniref:Raptor N-terminal CASPase-like domain-containing protein n=2 Tax=Heterodera trifolii TaxID=157864 RepID=A0ABD2JDW7_9BILA
MPADTNREEKEKVWFRETRHVENIRGASLEALKHKDDWRRICERMKTVSVALVLCLNIGTDPPDVQKPQPCARKEAWVDPAEPSVAHAQQRPAQRIAQSLQKIYEKLHPRARYKSAIDPTVDCVRKLCMSMRRNAKNERVLFHFNGHGVPKPSEAGEIWLFNHDITQYIPLSLYELQSWMGTPSVYLWDCNSAGTIINMFMRFAEDHSIRWMEEYREMRDRDQLQQQHQSVSAGTSVADSAAVAAGIAAAFGGNANALHNNNNDTASSTSTNSHSTIPSYKNCIHLGACSSGEQLSFHNADLPADLFTCCLTSPIQTSLLCHMLKTGTKNRFPPSIIDEIPGVLSDRRTLLGELNWIFTAITDAIAWCRLPRSTFQKLFRQDLLIASLFRAFLLSERIMRENGCHVVSTPQLPPVHDHPLWEYWDYTLDMCLTNLYNLLQPKQGYIQFTRSDCFVATPSLKHHLLIDLSLSAHANEYAYSWFFVEQLQAFEVWLKFGVDKCEPPQQLPVVLQVLLSVNHRLRALDLLARFIDMGPWAVLSALSVGIFPYVHRLLQCPTPEVRPALAFIWAKILAIDPGCQHELVKDNGYDYFLQVLNDQSVSPRMKIISAFVMATFIYKNYRPAQEKLVQSDYVTLCIELLSSELVTRCRMLVLWLLIGLGRLWAEYDKARWQAIRSVAYDKVVEFLNDDLPEVRAAAVFALGCFVHNTSRNNEHATAVENEVCDKLCEKCTYDGSVLVRAELAAAIQWFVIDFQSRFATICAELDRRVATQSPSSMMMIGNGTVQHGQELSKAMAAMCLSPTESELLLSDTASTASAVPPGADHHHHNSHWPASSSSAFSTLPRRKISARSGGGGGAFGNSNHHGLQPHQQQRQAPPAPSQGRRAAPANSSSASIYAILPRSASSIIPNPTNIRRRFSPIRKMSSILAGPSTASAAPTSPSGETAGLNSNSLFKFRVLSHIRSLESKTFIGPFERIWLCVLRLGLDPFDGVATMGEQIIRYIFELSSKIKESRDKALELKHSTGGRPISVNGPIMMNSGASGSQQISPADVQKQHQSHSHPEKVKFLVGTPQGVGTTTPMPSAVTPTNNIGTVVVPSGGGDVRSIGNSTPPPLVPIITTLPDGVGAVAATHPPPTPIAEEPPTGSCSTATTDPVAMMLARRCAPSPMRTPPTSTSSGAAAAITIGTPRCPGTTITTAGEENDDQQQQATTTSSASSTPSAAQQQQTSLNKKHPEMDNAKRRLLLDPFIHQSLYTPKRSIFGTQAGAYSQVADSNELLLAEQSATVAVEGLVRTSFVEWCAKTWTEPIYDTIYGLGRGIPTRNSLVAGASPFTMAQPTDWAIHTHEGIRQRAKKELEVLKTKHFRCETQIMQLKLDRPATSMAWSFLRPYVYIGDGERVRIYSYSTGDEYRQQQQHHHQYGADTSPQIPQPPPSSTLCSEFWAGSEPFLQDQITDLMVVNELTHELLMSGTRNGLLRVWDPMFHEHSHELLERPKMVTATYMLNDVPRVSGGQNRIIYHWDQRGGRLVCAGNVRICRVWDAWAERAVFDVTLKHAKGAVVAVGSELRFDLVSCGFSDGTVALFDIRVPAKGCEVLHLRDSNAPVVGMAMLGGDEQRERLLVGTRDGEIRLWEPRMFKEALVEFNVNRVQHRDSGDGGASRSGGYFGGSSSTAAFVDGQHRMMQQMEVQVQGELIACAMDDATVFLFDIDGRGGALSRLRWPTSSGGAGRALLSAAASSFYSPTGAISGISSLLWGRPRRNSSGGTSVTSGSGADNGSSSVSVFGDHHFTSPQRRQQQQTGTTGPPPPAAMRFHKQRVLLGLATAEGQFRSYAMPSSVDSGVSSNSTSGGAEDVLGTGAGGMASAVLRRI